MSGWVIKETFFHFLVDVFYAFQGKKQAKVIKQMQNINFFIWPELSVMLQHPLFRPLVGIPGDQGWYPYQRHCPSSVLALVMFTITSRH